VARGGYDELAGLGLVTGTVCLVVILGVLRRMGAFENQPDSTGPGGAASPPESES